MNKWKAASLVCLMAYFIFMVAAYFTSSLVVLLCLFIFALALFTKYSSSKLGGAKYLLSSPGYIFGLTFVPYAAIAILMFIIDGYETRISFFVNNYRTMLDTSKLYFYVYSILLVLLTVTSAVKKNDIKTNFNIIKNKLDGIFARITLIDITAALCVFINAAKVITVGGAFLGMTTLQKRAVFSSEISHYMNVFMVIYSLLLTLYYVNKKGERKNIIFRTAIALLYWMIYLTCERRMFVAYLACLAIVEITKAPKIKIKNVTLLLLIIAILLASAAARAGITLSNNKKLNDVLFMSFTEFVCTYSVSNYYVNNMESLTPANGKTYTYDSLTMFVPRALYEEKPVELGVQFRDKMKLNVGYSFNPISEGIYNFKEYAVIMVPIIILVIVIIANRLKNINMLLPIIISSFSIDFYRGQFSNFFFDSIFCIIIILLIFKIKRGRRSERV